MSVIRAFIAIDLSAEIQEKLEQISRQLRQQLRGSPIRWVHTQNIHLTLRFLGNVSLANLEVLENILLSEASHHGSFEISVGELGAFPSTRRPRVILVGVQAPQEMGQLQHSLEEAIRRLGYAPEEREFKPHLTLGRVSRSANSTEVQQIGQVLDNTNIGFVGAMHVRSVNLYRSDLQPSGAVYSCLFTANLLEGEHLGS